MSEELVEMIEWWLTLPIHDPAYRPRTLEQRNHEAARALADLMNMHGFRKDPRHPFPAFQAPGSDA